MLSLAACCALASDVTVRANRAVSAAEYLRNMCCLLKIV
jgi:hypothetical protein